MIENIILAFQSVWAHKVRSILTMLGIIIGIASIITIVSTIKGTNEQIKKNLVGSGVNAVVISLYQEDYQYSPYGSFPDNVAVITEKTRRSWRIWAASRTPPCFSSGITRKTRTIRTPPSPAACSAWIFTTLTCTTTTSPGAGALPRRTSTASKRS